MKIIFFLNIQQFVRCKEQILNHYFSLKNTKLELNLLKLHYFNLDQANTVAKPKLKERFLMEYGNNLAF